MFSQWATKIWKKNEKKEKVVSASEKKKWIHLHNITVPLQIVGQIYSFVNENDSKQSKVVILHNICMLQGVLDA